MGAEEQWAQRTEGTEEQWAQRITGNRGTVDTENSGNRGTVDREEQWAQRNSGNRGPVFTEEQRAGRNSGHGGTVGIDDMKEKELFANYLSSKPLDCSHVLYVLAFCSLELHQEEQVTEMKHYKQLSHLLGVSKLRSSLTMAWVMSC